MFGQPFYIKEGLKISETLNIMQKALEHISQKYTENYSITEDPSS